ncbi:type II toxin-antitoxin system VapC family toxin [Verminephrobacter aporrectodeae]|uniref:Ribonuclease VapC n=1 Tax=Verminephrobacter aporrectodeae subsp. tuberculatae TaxID=1110392 RepID=A0ABT3KTY7_9BURK|nr:type II toxin-antitoxin system VapC family toxin [Verminephrobacter aporrectodeae]MCW5222776.1 type II toxin-antitoxin system VapC family toxin [Verminephrobacter aporrectodeae subsp. tuberculatae]MCW5256996.1 type II toxin-antitoxin system VapC family toxin [Verminephrobacter aporrectodeae subsp. tuberculatae]MCW5288240.1 type II toxin-antitoxin system VapC family toxin [Verminephrobacter aporrectodeae subsp. tuberculatae]MCW5321793.1 type II toxin-antitoxin system VapC family toxin [Vermin
MFILDTCVLAELRANKPRAAQAVRAWASQQPMAGLYLSAVTLMELEIGVQRMQRKDPVQGAHLRAWAERTTERFEDRILPITARTAWVCASLHVPNPRPLGDSLIAATALEHGFTVVTRNLADFAGTGVKIHDPWTQTAVD